MKPRIKLTKEKFIQIMDALLEQDYENNKKNEAFQVLLPETFVCYTGDGLEPILLSILKEAFNDQGDWIGYYIYELDYGRKYEEGCATYKDGGNIDISTPSSLYDFLIKNMEEK